MAKLIGHVGINCSSKKTVIYKEEVYVYSQEEIEKRRSIAESELGKDFEVHLILGQNGDEKYNL